VGLVPDGAVAIADGQIVAVGTTAEVRRTLATAGIRTTLDAAGRVVMPGFVDPHAHLMAPPGKAAGLLDGATTPADEDELVALALERLDGLLGNGTTTVEIKGGCDLSVEDGLKQLRVAHRLSARHAVDVVPTLLAGHAAPSGNPGRLEEYLEFVIGELIPAVAEEELAEFCDVRVDRGALSAGQGRAVLEAGMEYGLMPKVHGDQCADAGAARLAAEVGAICAAQLRQASAEGLAAMARAGTIAVLLPAAEVSCGLPDGSARRFIDLGIPVALGTDVNPGLATWSMRAVMVEACARLGMTPAEAIVASTINAAWAVGLDEEIGSLEAGKVADLIVLDTTDYRQVAVGGGPLIRYVIKRGEVVAG
jgi:imidazolonepropionase